MAGQIMADNLMTVMIMVTRIMAATRIMVETRITTIKIMIIRIMTAKMIGKTAEATNHNHNRSLSHNPNRSLITIRVTVIRITE